MAKNRIIYTTVVIIAVLFSMAYKSRLTAVILMIFLAYPVAAAVFTAVQLFLVKADFADKRVVAEKNTSFELLIDIRNRSVLPCVPAELVCLTPNGGTFSEKRIYAVIPPGGRARLAIKCRHNFRGCYSCVIKKMAVVDPLRIVRLSRRIDSETVAVILPRKIELDDLIKISSTEHSYAKKNPISSDKEDFSHVREYRSGDIIQMVHWKLTAKQDELMIKQFDSVNDRRALILCGFGGAGDVLARTDGVIETAIAFVSKALKMGINSSVECGSSVRAVITNMQEFDSFYEMMAVLPPTSEPFDVSYIFGKANLDGLSVLVLITAELTGEIIAAARSAARVCAVFLAFVNVDAAPIDTALYESREFWFLNICGTAADAFSAAVEKLRENISAEK